jgi:CubicO group peptidase (beta-lactamase class C family)
MKNLLLFSGLLLLTWSCVSQSQDNLNQEMQAIENGLLKSIVVAGSEPATLNLEARMEELKVPGVSLAIVRDGKLRWAKGYGYANTNTSSKVDANTLFQAGSISKPVAALSVLKLLEEGKVDLETDVNQYLQSWKVPEHDFEEKVTLRRLLTHTAGTSVHGFPGYTQKDRFPTINEVLDGEGNTSRIYVSTPPDSVWRYSGGGYTIMEKVVEEVSGLPLETYMTSNILEPLQMTNSTYAQPLPESYHENASAAYDREGKIIKGLWHNYPEQAAAGLWTTPTDLAKYCIAVQEIVAGKEDGILSGETIQKMLTKHKNDWGLGPSLVWGGDSLRFQHGGKNAGFTNNMIAFANRGEAYIIMTNGDNGGQLMREIMRSVSSYYNLNMAKPREVSLASEGNYEIDPLVGKYNYVEEEYFVEVAQQGQLLILIDPNDGERHEMRAMNASDFIDLDDGTEIRFDLTKEPMEFVWNNQYRFYKVE